MRNLFHLCFFLTMGVSCGPFYDHCFTTRTTRRVPCYPMKVSNFISRLAIFQPPPLQDPPKNITPFTLTIPFDPRFPRHLAGLLQRVPVANGSGLHSPYVVWSSGRCWWGTLNVEGAVAHETVPWQRSWWRWKFHQPPWSSRLCCKDLLTVL